MNEASRDGVMQGRYSRMETLSVLALLAYTHAKVKANVTLPGLVPFHCRDCNLSVPILMCALSSEHLLTQILRLKIASPDLD